MDNFLLGLEGIARGAYFTIVAVIKHPMAWGFAGGFLVSTIVHLIIVLDEPSNLRHILTKKAAAAFAHIHKDHPDKDDEKFYLQFEKDYNRIKILFYSIVLVILAVMIVAMLKFDTATENYF
jgi:hypothetical protein